MTKEDLELKLLCDGPIYVDDVPVHRITMDDIATIGYSNYMEFVNLITLSEDSIKNIFQSDRAISQFDAVFALCLEPTLSANIGKFFTVIFGRPYKLIIEKMEFDFGDFKLTREKFPEVVRILKHRNGIASEDDAEEERPANEAVRRLLERRRELRRKVAKARPQGDTHVRLIDMISSLAVCNNVPLREIMSLDMAQLKHQLLRSRTYENYHLYLSALMHGADDKAKAKDYLGNIFDNNTDE